MATDSPLSTPLTKLLNIRHPILLAGMAHTATAPLSAAVSAAGGLGTIGGLGYSPEHLREMCQEIKATLQGQTAADGRPLGFGVDLALPQVGGTARKTNHDYTHGQLDELIDVIISEGTRLFVSAVGIPPPHVIKRLHDANIVVMNMVGKPHHAHKAFQAGVDIVCAQGGEGGGHTGDIPQHLLVPACVDVARQYKPAMLQGGPGLVVAAGGVYDGRGLAAALVQGAVGVWVGTRFVASEEAGCSRAHKDAVVTCDWEDTTRTLVVSGRPLRVRRNDYVKHYELRPDEVKSLTDKGIVPMMRDLEEEREHTDMPFLMGQVAALINDVKPARQIVNDMVAQALECLHAATGYATGPGQARSKL